METVWLALQESQRLAKRPRQLLHRLLSLGRIIFSALMLWQGLMVWTNSASPLLVVLSGGDTTFGRGDILFLTLTDEQFAAADVVVFVLEGRGIPIVHRLLSVHEAPFGELAMLTKGNENQVDDRGLYPNGQLFLSKTDVLGRVRAYLPYLGITTIWLDDYLWLKYWLLATASMYYVAGQGSWTWIAVLILADVVNGTFV